MNTLFDRNTNREKSIDSIIINALLADRAKYEDYLRAAKTEEDKKLHNEILSEIKEALDRENERILSKKYKNNY
jgi:hypothetical protein